ncbi:MAG: hypothetical protein R3B07_25790 [Polyangiaceae bacterium]
MTQLSSAFVLLTIGLCTVALGAGCGETSDSGAGGSGGSAGSAGSSGAAGTGGGSAGTAGTAGTSTGGAGGSPQCPEKAPENYEACSQDVNPEGCTYGALCSSGSHPAFTFTCGSDGHWLLAEKACELQAERCEGLPISCDQGYWSYWTGVNPQPTCPALRPEGDSPCTPNDGECGYYCTDGVTWSVLYCNGSTWVSDGACP